jgi:hypothetical protein
VALPETTAPAINLAHNTFLVRMLQQVLSHADENLNTLPGSMGRVIEEDAFHAFNIPGGGIRR